MTLAMETTHPSLAQQVAGITAEIRARADHQAEQAHWAAPAASVRALILALLARLFGRLAAIMAAWESGQLQAPAPRAPRATTAPSPRPAARAAAPRARSLYARPPAPPHALLASCAVARPQAVMRAPTPTPRASARKPESVRASALPWLPAQKNAPQPFGRSAPYLFRFRKITSVMAPQPPR